MKILLNFIFFMSLCFSSIAEETKNGWNLIMPENTNTHQSTHTDVAPQS